MGLSERPANSAGSPALADSLVNHCVNNSNNVTHRRCQSRMSLLLLLLLLFFTRTNATDNGLGYDTGVVDLTKIPYSYATTTFVRNEVFYSFGGVTRTTDASQNFMSIRLNSTTGEVVYETVAQTGPVIPYAAYSQGILLPGSDRFILFGGGFNESDIVDRDGDLRMFEYRFDNQKWTYLNNISTSSSVFPVNRGQFTADLAPNGKVYFYGGQTPVGKLALSDAWVYDPKMASLSLIPPMPGFNMSLFGHLSIMLPSGIIVYLMGTGELNNTVYDNNVNDTLCDMALLFDTNSHQWQYQPLGGDEQDIPQQIINGYAALGPDQQTIYLSGGFGASRTLDQQSVSSNDMSILSTVSWRWLPNDHIKGATPKPRFYTNAERLSDTAIIVAFGTSEYFWYNDINLLEFTTLPDGTYIGIWRTNISTPLPLVVSANASGLTSEQKTGIAVGAFVIFVVFAFFVSWYFRKTVRQFINRSYRGVIWTIRVGEPLWTGVSHILSKIILSFLFLAYLVFIVKSVIDSGRTTIEITQSVDWVLLPDIRFCFDGYTNTVVGCETESLSIDDCVQRNYTHRLNMTEHMPYFDYSGVIECHLFHADDDFILSASSNLNQTAQTYFGSRIQFSFFGIPANADQVENDERFVHIAVYPRHRNPNVDFYFDKEKYMTSNELQNWLMGDANNLASSTDHRTTLIANTSATLSYQLVLYQALQNSVWNSVGIAPSYIDTDEVEATFSPGVKRYLRPGNSAGSVNFLDVYPEGFIEKKRVEQKLYTFLSSVGSVGGLLSLLVTINSWLFGARPRSPWGIVHRALWGNLSKNWLLNGLGAKFGGISTDIPFVHPVGSNLLTDDQADCFSLEMNRQQRESEQRKRQSTFLSSSAPINRRDTTITESSARTRCENSEALAEYPMVAVLVDQVEALQRRIQLTELVLKEYYIDDEVFRNISVAVELIERNPGCASLSSSERRRRGAGGSTSESMAAHIGMPLTRHLSIQSASIYPHRHHDHNRGDQMMVQSSSSLPLPETLMGDEMCLNKKI